MENQKHTLGAQQQSNITHGLMPEQIVTKMQTAAQSGPGTDFIVIQRVRQGEDPLVWSTGDLDQTKGLFRDATTSLAYDKEFERT